MKARPAVLGAIATLLLALPPSAMANDTIVVAAVAPLGVAEQTGPLAPSDPVKHAAFDVLDVHCARCHQSGKLVGRSKPAKGFANILDLEAIGANSKYVKRGDPDRSLIYHVIVRHEMPSDVFQDGDLDHPVPGSEDLQKLRKWITALAKEQAPLIAHNDSPAAKDWQALQTPGNQDSALAASLGQTANDLKSSAPVQVASLAHPGEPVPLGRDDLGQAAGPDKKLSALGSRDLVYDAQDRLQKLGCFSGTPSGVLDRDTDSALARYNTKLGRGTAVAAITPELVEELKSQTGRICTRICPRGQIAAGPTCIPDPDAVEQATAPTPKNNDQAIGSFGQPVDATRRLKRVTPPPGNAAVAVAPQPARRAAVVASAPKPARQLPRTLQQAPQRRIARDVPLRQPAFRQAARPAARAAPAQSTATSTVSGVNGI